MSEQFEKFIQDVQKNDFWVLYAQVRKDGQIIDDWKRFSAKMRWESMSMAKSFAGLGIGIAIDEGIISLDERIADSFKKESWDVSDPLVMELTVRDVITMTIGADKPMFWRDSYERAHCQDWIRYFYRESTFVRPGGERFLYSNINPYLLGCLIHRKTGQNLHEFLRYRALEPLEIPNSDFTTCPMGQTVAANGMAINVDELGNFCQMLLDGGVFKGKRIVSEVWTKEMMSPLIETTDIVPGATDTHMRYGYQMWVDPVNNAAFAWGVYGNYGIVLKDKGIVISVLALEKTDGGSNGDYHESPLRKSIWENLVTKF